MSCLKKQKDEMEPAVVSAKKFFHYLLHCLICIYIALILGVLPFYFTDGYYRIGTDKSTFFSQTGVIGARLVIPILTCYLVTAFLVYRQDRKKGVINESVWVSLKRDLSVTDAFAAVYGISLFVSYICSDYKDMALWGADWWFMGLYPQIMLLSAYFLISRFWIPRKEMFFLIFPVSGVVFFLGILNRFGIYPIFMELQNAQFISTIGNINWYCGYLVSVFFGGVFLLWVRFGSRPWQRALLTAYVTVGFGTLVTQGSSSGILTMAVLLLAFFLLSASDESRMLEFWKLLMILSAVCMAVFFVHRVFPGRMTYIETASELLTNTFLPFLLAGAATVLYMATVWMIRKKRFNERLWRNLSKAVAFGILGAVMLFILLIYINTLLPGSIGPLSNMDAFTFSPQWGSNRGATWRAGIMCFAEQGLLHKLVGIGPDCMPAYLYRDGSPELLAMVSERFGTLELTNAHNEWLTTLVNMGIVGFVGYAGMFVTGIFRYIRQRESNYIAAAAGFCLLAYTVNNMFSFQQAMNTSTIFVIFGMGEAYIRAYMRKSVRFPE